jgi:hypothetical protein
MRELKRMDERVEEILRHINALDSLYWRLLSKAAGAQDRELVHLADQFLYEMDRLFVKVSNLKEGKEDHG